MGPECEPKHWHSILAETLFHTERLLYMKAWVPVVCFQNKQGGKLSSILGVNYMNVQTGRKILYQVCERAQLL